MPSQRITLWVDLQILFWVQTLQTLIWLVLRPTPVTADRDGVLYLLADRATPRVLELDSILKTYTATYLKYTLMV